MGSGYGIDIDGTKVSVLQYADDIAIMAESEEQLQNMLDILYNWCRVNKMQVSLEKTNVVHYRNVSTNRTDCTFQFGTDKIDISESCKYLGLVLDEFLNYDITAKYVANYATRALGLVKQQEGFLTKFLPNFLTRLSGQRSTIGQLSGVRKIIAVSTRCRIGHAVISWELESTPKQRSKWRHGLDAGMRQAMGQRIKVTYTDGEYGRLQIKSEGPPLDVQ